MIIRVFSIAFICGFLGVTPALAGGHLSDNIRIESNALGYTHQYRVYTPAGLAADAQLPALYITDGEGYLDETNFIEVLDREITAGTIRPLVAIFLDARNPDDLAENRRQTQYFCAPEYVDFFRRELVPRINQTYPVSRDRRDRVLLGVSYGGHSAACFGLTAWQDFAGIAMQSPSNTDRMKTMTARYQSADAKPVKLFMSVGTINDSTEAVRAFSRTLDKKGYDLTYIEVPFGHTLENWVPLIDDILVTFFARE